MKSIVARSPTRVDLAGGTLDLWPLYAIAGGATTVNVAISVWTEVSMAPAPGLQLYSLDLNREWKFKDLGELASQEGDHQLKLFRELLLHFPELKDCRITTRSESPVGGGIGGSSSLTISCLKAIHQWLGRKLPSPNDLVHFAHNVEARILRTPTGTQDYFPAVSGGLNILDYSDYGVRQTVLSLRDTPLASHALVVNTGRSHNSGLNNFDVFTRVIKGEEKVMAALNEIRRVAAETRRVCVTQEWQRLPDLFRQETAARLQLTPLFSSPEIQRLEKSVLEEGASAIKICGAGGGGCVLTWVNPQYRERVMRRCQDEGFQLLNADPVEPLDSYANG
ncbi:MAG: galactokinase [Bdellovibrio sp.]|nr:MAG: galactokinase [Bdellovibrio sp.]